MTELNETIETEDSEKEDIISKDSDNYKPDTDTEQKTVDPVEVKTTSIVQKSIYAIKKVPVNDFRKREKSMNNIYQSMELQNTNTVFYLTTRNKHYEKGTIYGKRSGKMTNDKQLAIYHKEDPGFYVGWGIYVWNNKLLLDHN